MPVRLNGAVVDDRALRGVVTFIVLYMGLFAFGALGLVVDATRADVDVESVRGAGRGGRVPRKRRARASASPGRTGSYAPFSDLSTVVLTGLMWLGRLEIIPVAVLLTRGYWRA